MRTTIRLDDALLSEAKQAAHASGRTLTAVIEDALREVLGRKAQSPKTARVSLTTFGSGGVRPGVDLDDAAGLRELMDDGAP